MAGADISTVTYRLHSSDLVSVLQAPVPDLMEGAVHRRRYRDATRVGVVEFGYPRFVLGREETLFYRDAVRATILERMVDGVGVGYLRRRARRPRIVGDTPVARYEFVDVLFDLAKRHVTAPKFFANNTLGQLVDYVLGFATGWVRGALASNPSIEAYSVGGGTVLEELSHLAEKADLLLRSAPAVDAQRRFLADFLAAPTAAPVAHLWLGENLVGLEVEELDDVGFSRVRVLLDDGTGLETAEFPIYSIASNGANETAIATRGLVIPSDGSLVSPAAYLDAGAGADFAIARTERQPAADRTVFYVSVPLATVTAQVAVGGTFRLVDAPTNGAPIKFLADAGLVIDKGIIDEELALSARAAENVLLNPDFSNAWVGGAPAKWTKTGTPTLAEVTAQEETIAGELTPVILVGSKSVRVTTSADSQGLEQTHTIAPTGKWSAMAVPHVVSGKARFIVENTNSNTVSPVTRPAFAALGEEATGAAIEEPTVTVATDYVREALTASSYTGAGGTRAIWRGDAGAAGATVKVFRRFLSSPGMVEGAGTGEETITLSANAADESVNGACFQQADVGSVVWHAFMHVIEVTAGSASDVRGKLERRATNCSGTVSETTAFGTAMTPTGRVLGACRDANIGTTNKRATEITVHVSATVQKEPNVFRGVKFIFNVKRGDGSIVATSTINWDVAGINSVVPSGSTTATISGLPLDVYDVELLVQSDATGTLESFTLTKVVYRLGSTGGTPNLPGTGHAGFHANIEATEYAGDLFVFTLKDARTSGGSVTYARVLVSLLDLGGQIIRGLEATNQAFTPGQERTYIVDHSGGPSTDPAAHPNLDVYDLGAWVISEVGAGNPFTLTQVVIKANTGAGDPDLRLVDISTPEARTGTLPMGLKSIIPVGTTVKVKLWTYGSVAHQVIWDMATFVNQELQSLDEVVVENTGLSAFLAASAHFGAQSASATRFTAQFWDRQRYNKSLYPFDSFDAGEVVRIAATGLEAALDPADFRVVEKREFEDVLGRAEADLGDRPVRLGGLFLGLADETDSVRQEMYTRLRGLKRFFEQTAGGG